MGSFHTAVQVDSALWAVTFVSEFGFHETRILTSAEFIKVISAEAQLADNFDEATGVGSISAQI
ncbi:hypothetical protein [Rhizobium leguminosarum]|uniref:hypothetical protein n=1 Tax=Rhizobium leguminosarum TaxID=384 RepID=UPI0024B34984|nr:hypothetical protein [Rhizobium leguminosarum]WHO82594.1 hypothetical protein QMO81_005464 [Rhizobium leguminosarum]